MTGKTHLACGLMSGAAFAAALNLSVWGRLSFAAIAGFGALLPDLDHPQSILTRAVWRFFWISLGVTALLLSLGRFEQARLMLFLGVAIILPRLILKVLSVHRGVTHSAVGVIGLFTLGTLSVYALTTYQVLNKTNSLFSMRAMIALSVGMLIGGVIPDGMTPSGITFFLPFSYRKIHLLPTSLRILTGTYWDYMIIRTSSLLLTLYLLWP